jgi:bifunctional NMN adenylyltransferase/nudix hydrolase
MMRVGVFIGRFSPLHKGHEAVVRQILAEQDAVIILLGSAYQAPNTRCPFNVHERIEMFHQAFTKEEFERMFFQGIRDYPYSDTRWQYAIQDAIENNKKNLRLWSKSGEENNFEITLYGFNKDDTSYYLKIFPQWNRIEISPVELGTKIYNATDVRKELLTGPLNQTYPDCSPGVNNYLNFWILDTKADWLRKEYKFEQNYQEPYRVLPYPPIFQTVDNIVLWRGMVLMIQRRHRPGMGLWALPGGFLNVNETKRAAAERELQEETHIEIFRHTKNGTTRVPMDSAWIQQVRSFDHPLRSQRGRTITEGYLWRIPDVLEVTHRADDDAAKSKFIPLNEILGNMSEIIFEDHSSIIAEMCLRT